ncbi:hypothetical protein DID74_02310 [Candidatus Marinamargulisbacteria bacterium SCGC AG-333-B06]|nr:hypothetical protein DID74_02310 [Candidatus Marinamargulisbacteria bacterium SCGC AG-333-B06]
MRYCLSCKKICDDSNILLAGKTYQCASCKNILIYFGREEASISVDSIIAKYDAFHPYKPREDFRGVSKDYDNPQADIGVIECEEILKHHPTNQESLRYLSKHYWAKGATKRALDYMNKLNQINAVLSEDILYYMNLLIIQKSYQNIMDFLIENKSIITAFLFHHYYAISYLGLNQFKEALEHFYQAYQQCDNVDRKKKIRKIIRYLSTILDQPIR